MKRTLSSAQTTVPPETLTDPNGLEENLPDPSWIEESFPGTPSEQTSYEPKLLNRSAIDSSTLIPVELNDSCDVKDQHSAPEKSDRSTSATSTATSATNNDEIEALEKFPLSAGTEVPFKLDLCYDFGQDIELSKEKIFKTVEKAALNDDVYSQTSLAMMGAASYRWQLGEFKFRLPASQLVLLGSPLNTLKPSGEMRLTASSLTLKPKPEHFCS